MKKISLILMIIFLITMTGIVSATSSIVKIDPYKPITVTGGKITGISSEDREVAIYKGIPFAAPPVGNLRWKAPQPVVPWNGVKEATEFSASAIQPPQGPFMFWSTEFIIDTSKGYSEDSLYLNVWTQTESSEENRPVIVYIHGGGNTSGGASCDVYDGEEIAKKDVVYVSINYRVGIFGFLAHPELSDESPDNVSGNYAILDQIAALKWVKNNIDKFGGDSNNVTIAGQSAGSRNVHSLISSPMAKGLFKNAVTMSANAIDPSPLTNLVTLEEKEKEGNKLFKNKTLAEMREMSPEELLKISRNFKASSNIDGKVITGGTLDTYKDGTANDVNLMTGMVEGDFSASLFPVLPVAPSFTQVKTLSKEKYETAVKDKFGSLAEEVLKLYPATNNDAIDAYNELNRDGTMALQYYLAKARNLNSNNNTYIYYFTHMMPGPKAAEMGAFHTADVPYWLNHFSALREDYWAKIDYKLGDKMTSYLVNFAKTGNPNGCSLPEWKQYDSKNISFNVLGDEITFETLSKEKTKLWKSYFGSVFNL